MSLSVLKSQIGDCRGMVYVKVSTSGYSPIISDGEMLIFHEKSSSQCQSEWCRNVSLARNPPAIGVPLEHMDRISHVLGFNVLILGIYYKRLPDSYAIVLERMPEQVRERRYPEFVNRMSNRQKLNDISQLFIPLLLDMFLRHQIRNLEQSSQDTVSYRALYNYLRDAQKLLSRILGAGFADVASRLEVEEWSTLLAPKGACSLSDVDDDVLSCFDGYSAVTHSAWTAWLRYVFTSSLEYEPVEMGRNKSFNTTEVKRTHEPIGHIDKTVIQDDSTADSDMMNYSLDRIDEMLESKDLFKLVSDITC